jgi:hypothetical protein
MSVMAVTKRTIELPTGGLVGVVRGEGQFTNAMPSRDQAQPLAVHVGNSRSVDFNLECAPRGGQDYAAVLTVCQAW